MLIRRDAAGAGRRVSRRARSWNALKSGFTAFSGLVQVVRDNPSLQLGVGVSAAAVALGLIMRLGTTELGALVLACTLILAAETLNTSVEMVCDHFEPQRDPAIGKIKDVAAGATAFCELGAAIVALLVFAPHFARLLGH